MFNGFDVVPCYRNSIPQVLKKAVETGYQILLYGRGSDAIVTTVRIIVDSRFMDRVEALGVNLDNHNEWNEFWQNLDPNTFNKMNIFCDTGTSSLILPNINVNHTMSEVLAERFNCLWFSPKELFPLSEFNLGSKMKPDVHQLVLVFGHKIKFITDSLKSRLGNLGFRSEFEYTPYTKRMVNSKDAFGKFIVFFHGQIDMLNVVSMYDFIGNKYMVDRQSVPQTHVVWYDVNTEIYPKSAEDEYNFNPQNHEYSRFKDWLSTKNVMRYEVEPY